MPINLPPARVDLQLRLCPPLAAPCSLPGHHLLATSPLWSQVDEAAKFEAERAEELRKLQRDRRVLEKQSRAILKMPTKQSKEEVAAVEVGLAAWDGCKGQGGGCRDGVVVPASGAGWWQQGSVWQLRPRCGGIPMCGGRHSFW